LLDDNFVDPQCELSNMADDSRTNAIDPHLIARIVTAYARHHNVGTDQVPAVIATVHQALAGLGGASPAIAERVPAVPIRRSVRNDHLVCLECGLRVQALRRHLRTRHNLDPDAYRARWKLRSDYPVVPPALSQQRSSLAKQIGLGRRAAANSPAPKNAAAVEPIITAAPSRPKRRARPRRSRPTA
jgi:predicted transcriptional regulator